MKRTQLRQDPHGHSTARPAITRPTAVFLVDEQPLMLAGLRALLTCELGLRVCGEASSVHDALAGLPAANPDVVLTDLTVGKENGLDLIAAARALPRPPKVIVLSMHDEALHAELALRRGAAGYLMKSKPAGEVVHAVRLAARGEIYVSPEVNARLLERFGRGTPDPVGGVAALSERELEVFRLIGTGLSTGEVGKALHISPKTVETHRMNIKLKLGLSTSAQLLLSAANWLREH
jgi:DNA-binding NarL/FixJ family response regulator